MNEPRPGRGSGHTQLYVDSQFASPYAMSAFVALTEKRMEFEVVPVNLGAGGQHSPRYARLSLTQRVPTLVDGDFSLSESSAIAEYVEGTRPGPLLYPADERSRARARQVQAWVRSDFLEIRQERTTEIVFLGGRPAAPLSEAAQAAAQRLFAAAEGLLRHGNDNLFGAWCIADTDLALMLNRLCMAGDPVPPVLAAYARRQWQRPSTRRWVERERAAE
jgi:glutathione S-transferase